MLQDITPQNPNNQRRFSGYLPWDKPLSEYGVQDWIVATGYHPSHATSARDLRVSNAIAYLSYKNTGITWQSQETMAQLAHVADRSQIRKSLKSLKGSGALHVDSISNLPTDLVPASLAKRDPRGSFYRCDFRWARETILTHFGRHQSAPKRDTNIEIYGSAADPYFEQGYGSAAARGYGSAADPLNFNRTTMKEEGELSAFGSDPCAARPSASSNERSSEEGPDVVGDRNLASQAIWQKINQVDPYLEDLSEEETIILLSDIDFVRQWGNMNLADRANFAGLMRMSAKGILRREHLKEMAA